MSTLNLQASRLDINGYPGNTHTITLTFPADALDGTTWTATIDGTAVDSVAVAGDDLVVDLTIPATVGGYPLVIAQATPDDNVQITGTVVSTRTPTSSQTATSLTLTLDEASTTVTVNAVDTPRPAPMQVTKVDGDVTVANTSGAWVDTDNGGSSAARPLDIVFSDVAAGDWVTVAPSLIADGQASNVSLRFATIVGGAVVNGMGDPEAGIPSWYLVGGSVRSAGGGVSYQVQAGDIEGGDVRMRLQHNSTAGRIIRAGTIFPLILEGSGPFV